MTGVGPAQVQVTAQEQADAIVNFIYNQFRTAGRTGIPTEVESALETIRHYANPAWNAQRQYAGGFRGALLTKIEGLPPQEQERLTKAITTVLEDQSIQSLPDRDGKELRALYLEESRKPLYQRFTSRPSTDTTDTETKSTGPGDGAANGGTPGTSQPGIDTNGAGSQTPPPPEPPVVHKEQSVEEQMQELRTQITMISQSGGATDPMQGQLIELAQEYIGAISSVQAENPEKAAACLRDLRTTLALIGTAQSRDNQSVQYAINTIKGQMALNANWLKLDYETRTQDSKVDAANAQYETKIAQAEERARIAEAKAAKAESDAEKRIAENEAEIARIRLEMENLKELVNAEHEAEMSELEAKTAGNEQKEAKADLGTAESEARIPYVEGIAATEANAEMARAEAQEARSDARIADAQLETARIEGEMPYAEREGEGTAAVTIARNDAAFVQARMRMMGNINKEIQRIQRETFPMSPAQAAREILNREQRRESDQNRRQDSQRRSLGRSLGRGMGRLGAALGGFVDRGGGGDGSSMDEDINNLNRANEIAAEVATQQYAFALEQFRIRNGLSQQWVAAYTAYTLDPNGVEADPEKMNLLFHPSLMGQFSD